MIPASYDDWNSASEATHPLTTRPVTSLVLISLAKDRLSSRDVENSVTLSKLSRPTEVSFLEIYVCVCETK